MVMGWEISEAIHQQARSRIEEGDLCEHGNARGFSSWDTHLCSACAEDEARMLAAYDDERAEREALERGEPWPPEPEPEPDDAARVLTVDEVPF